MSLFKEYEYSANVYLPVDNTSKKITNYTNISFTTKVNDIRLGAEDSLIQGQQLGEYRANVRAAYNGARITEGAVIEIVSTGRKYQVVNKPKLLRLFNRYKLNLKPV